MKAFIFDRNFCLWQNKFCDRNFFSVTETFFLWQKHFPSSMLKICFSDGNLDRNLFLWWKLVSWGRFFSGRIFCLTETCFCDINFFCDRNLFPSQFFSSLTVSCFCDQTLFGPKHPFLGILYVISREMFLWEWKFPLSWIPNIPTLWSPVCGFFLVYLWYHHIVFLLVLDWHLINRPGVAGAVL